MRVVPKKMLPVYLQRTGTRVLKSQRGGSVMDQYQAAVNKANQANETRYQDILRGYDDLAARTRADLAAAGQSTMADINRTYSGTSSNMYQQLVNRGLANSSIPATMQMGIDRSRAESVARANELAANSRVNADMSITQGKLGVMERRTDAGPDPNQIMELYRRLGASGQFAPGAGGRMYGQPIGMTPDMVANMYNTGLANHMAMMNGPAMMFNAARQQDLARRRQRVLENKARRAGKRNRINDEPFEF